jgi:hypothetical protein
MRAFYIVATLLALALLGALAYLSWSEQEQARQEKARQAREACEKRNSEKRARAEEVPLYLGESGKSLILQTLEDCEGAR